MIQPDFSRSLLAPLALAAALLAQAPGAQAGQDCPSAEILAISEVFFSDPTSITMHEGAAYVLDANSNLFALDLSDPTFHHLLSVTYIHRHGGDHINFHDGFAYFYWENELSFNEPAFRVHGIDDEGEFWYVRDHYADMLNAFRTASGLLIAGDSIIDTGVPYAPVTRSRFPDNQTGLICVAENLVLTDDLGVYDVSDPFAPAVITPPPSFTLNLEQIAPLDQTRYCARRGDTFHVIERTGPNTYASTRTFTIADAQEFTSRGSILTVRTSESLLLVDISNPAHPVTLFDTADLPQLGGVADYIYIEDTLHLLLENGAMAALGLHTSPAGTHATADEAVDVDAIGNLALVADTDAGLAIFDVSDPTNPVLRSTFATANEALGVDVIPGIAFVAAHQAGLDIVDISDPDAPQLITNYNPGNSIRDVQVVGDLAYALNRVQGLIVLDIADPANPAVLSITDTPALAERLTVAGDLAVVAQGAFDTQILDISDPANPQIIAVIEPSTNKTGIFHTAIQGHLLYVADRDAGYRIFDITNPANPLLLTTLDPDIDDNSSVYALNIQSNLLHIAHESSGLTTLDNTDPLNPVIIANHPASQADASGSPTRFLNLARQGQHIYVAADAGGLRVFDLAPCPQPCPADFNNDGSLNFFDISLFLTAFNNQDPAADLNNDGSHNFFDLSSLLAYFSDGCP